MTDICPVCQAPVAPSEGTCPQCGFKLLGTTQKFVPLSVDGASGAPAQDVRSEAALRVLRGPQAGVSYRLAEDELTIGRNPQCSIFLNDMTVSRMHALMRRENGCYVITDQNSFNGVWVNNKNVEAKALRPGDVIQIGTFCLLYEESGQL